jgi:hypothetical protein
MLVSPFKPSSTIRIFSSVLNLRRVLLLISFTTASGESILGWFMAGTPSSFPDKIRKPHLIFYPKSV